MAKTVYQPQSTSYLRLSVVRAQHKRKITTKDRIINRPAADRVGIHPRAGGRRLA